MEEIVENIKIAYLRYKDNNFITCFSYLKSIIQDIIEIDYEIGSDIFWRTLATDVFIALNLNEFSNIKCCSDIKIDFLLKEDDEIQKDILNFCNKFRNNDKIDFISHIENVKVDAFKKIVDNIKIYINKIDKEIIIRNNSDVIKYYKLNWYKDNFDEGPITNYIKTNKNNKDLCIDAARDLQFGLVKIIINETSVDILKNSCYFEDIEYTFFGEFYGLLCYLTKKEPMISEYKKESCYDLIRFLKNKGLIGDAIIQIKNGYRERRIDYSKYLDRIINKISKYTFAKKVLKTIYKMEFEEDKVTFSKSYTSGHGIDTYLEIYKIDNDIYDELKDDKTLLKTFGSQESTEVKICLRNMDGFEDYVFDKDLLLVRDLFIEEGDYKISCYSLTDW